MATIRTEAKTTRGVRNVHKTADDEEEIFEKSVIGRPPS